MVIKRGLESEMENINGSGSYSDYNSRGFSHLKPPFSGCELVILWVLWVKKVGRITFVTT